jgi:hypothetical protein
MREMRAMQNFSLKRIRKPTLGRPGHRCRWQFILEYILKKPSVSDSTGFDWHRRGSRNRFVLIVIIFRFSVCECFDWLRKYSLNSVFPFSWKLIMIKTRCYTRFCWSPTGKRQNSFRTLHSRGHSGEKREANCGVSCSWEGTNS